MKTRQKLTLDEQAESMVKELRTKCDQAHEQYLENNVRRSARACAQSGVPRLDDEKLDPYVQDIVGHYSTERTNVQIEMAGKIQALLGSISIDAHKRGIEEKNDSINSVQRKIDTGRDALEDYHINRSVSSYHFYQVFLWVLMIMESAWLSLVFSGLGDNNLMVLIGAAVVSITLITSVKLLTLYVRDRPWDEISYFTRFAIALYVIAVVVAIGLLRYVSITTNNEGYLVKIQYLNHPIIFMIITAIPLVATFLIVHKYFLSDEERLKVKHANRVKRECHVAEQEKAKHLAERDRLIQKREDTAHMRIKLNHYEQALMERFDGYLIKAIGTFKLENLKHRSDGCPKCFNNDTVRLPQTNIYTESNYLTKNIPS